MIILDTNVISEAMKPAPNPVVIKWLNDKPAETLFLSSVTLAELLFGIGMLPEGKRKNALTEVLEGLLALFGERILPFDTDAARCYADIAVKSRAAGRGFPVPDGYIAAIAASRDYIVATRDTSPFEMTGLVAVNPFQEVRA